MNELAEELTPAVENIAPASYIEEDDYNYPSTPKQRQMIEEIPKNGLSDKVIGLIIIHETFRKGGWGYYYEPSVMRVVAVTENGYEVRIPKIRGIGESGGPIKCFRIIADFFKPLIGQEISFYKQNQYHRSLDDDGFYETQVKVRVKSLPDKMRGISDMRMVKLVRN